MTGWRWALGDGGYSAAQRAEIELAADAAMAEVGPVYAVEAAVYVLPDAVLHGWVSIGAIPPEQVGAALPALVRDDGRGAYLVVLAPEIQSLVDARMLRSWLAGDTA